MVYFRTIAGLVGEWPDCWSLIYLAEDKGRAEILPRKRRAFESSIAAGNPPPPLWDASSPWSACLLALANDDSYWNRNARNLCVFPGSRAAVTASRRPGNNKLRRRPSRAVVGRWSSLRTVPC